jgi:hypothetical protein
VDRRLPASGDWIWPVKENQPDLLAAIDDAFDDAGVSPRERKLAEAERQTAASTDKGVVGQFAFPGTGGTPVSRSRRR